MANQSIKQKVTNGSQVKSGTKGMTKSNTIKHKSAAKTTNKLDKEAEQQAKKILLALEEANEIHSGRKKAKSFSGFIKEL